MRELIERIDSELCTTVPANQLCTIPLTREVADLLRDCKAALSQEAQPVASVPQDVEEFISANAIEGDGYNAAPLYITVDDLRTWMAGHARVPVEPTQKMLNAAEKVDWSNEDTRGSIINMWQAMIAAS